LTQNDRGAGGEPNAAALATPPGAGMVLEICPAKRDARCLPQRGGNMRHILVLAATAVLAAAFVGTAAADRVYHTERLQLSGLAGAPGGGMVVNIHPNGPNVYAHEIYTLRQAVPGTYQVFLNVFPMSLNCTGPTTAIPTAALTTNAIGNGRADVKFTPGDVAALRGMTFSISWTVAGPATYVSACTVVTLD
jgi:hypothetical protein